MAPRRPRGEEEGEEDNLEERAGIYAEDFPGTQCCSTSTGVAPFYAWQFSIDQGLILSQTHRGDLLLLFHTMP